MAKDDLIDDRVSTSQIQKAVDALHAYESKKQEEREETDLLSGKEPIIWLNVAVKQVAPKNVIKPHKIPIAHPIVDPRTTSICLITKDPQREYKDLLEEHNIKFISRVVGIAKLKGKYKAFEARRLLLKENGLFLADERVIPLLPKLLGAKWFEAKKQPIPVCMTRKDLKGELERAISSTYMHLNNGTCTSIKIGTLSHKPSQVVSNIAKAIPAIAARIPAQWDNIQSLFIKTNTSVSLPIWSCNLDERWGGLKKEEETTKKNVKSGKGKKRHVVEEGADDDDDDDNDDGDDDDVAEVSEQPRKKQKTNATGKITTPSSTSKPKKSPQPTDPQPLKSKKSAKSTSADLEKQQSQPQQRLQPKNKTQKSESREQEQLKPEQDTKPKPRTSAASKNDMKQKRTAVGGSLEKKKEKILNKKIGSGVNGKDAKAKVLGKKVAFLT
ncbi:hypothetical protein AGABI1DRAFT_120606 [Agaricus bisporus var. burnettii JB137-S8]|uniref:Ribosomal L1 domain-containing protein 1 n=1 Tax=Agaricus bisporus var. burnettii (strain JB137-S8 / ATCC MYA-4627 / FGSC 10392) TaxID=597362 RepID=K5WUQ0_AGABU|nr:uncharacterized protein AGABI1DRAFT_120606 [Agaricus bisporus var. burnettii JB137-S8]EKM79166.1 hypothetical protein AGABI1DRAFT_120606 [Agaricus bisporus var. burnettii JB137-S8]